MSSETISFSETKINPKRMEEFSADYRIELRHEAVVIIAKAFLPLVDNEQPVPSTNSRFISVGEKRYSYIPIAWNVDPSQWVDKFAGPIPIVVLENGMWRASRLHFWLLPIIETVA